MYYNKKGINKTKNVFSSAENCQYSDRIQAMQRSKCDFIVNEDCFRYRGIQYSIILTLLLSGICIGIYFMDFLKSYIIWESFFVMLFFVFLFYTRKSINIVEYIVPLLAFCLYLVVNVLVGGLITFISAFILNIILLIFLTNTPLASVILSKIMALFALVHLFFTMLVEVLPSSIIDRINSIILSSTYWSNWDWRNRQNCNVGITSQPGSNALYLTTLLAFCFAHILTSKKNKTMYWICIALTSAGIISTTKRSAIVFNAICIIIVYMIYNMKYNKKRINANKILKVMGAIVVSAILFLIIYIKTDVFSGIISKMTKLTSSNDITNGRLTLWSYAFEQFWKNPMFGVGLKKIYGIIGFDVHNVYIQLLAESGIIGFIIFLGALIKITKQSIKNVYYLRDCKDTNVKRSYIMGLYLIIYFIIYGVVGNPFIDYIPLGIFICSVFLANSYGKFRWLRR